MTSWCLGEMHKHLKYIKMKKHASNFVRIVERNGRRDSVDSRHMDVLYHVLPDFYE